jgi:hypothetical protein
METKNEFEVSSTVTMSLNEYNRITGVIKDEREKNSAMSATLTKWSEFLRQLDGNPRIIEMYTKELDSSQKIGTAFYASFDEFIKQSKMDFKEINK